VKDSASERLSVQPIGGPPDGVSPRTVLSAVDVSLSNSSGHPRRAPGEGDVPVCRPSRHARSRTLDHQIGASGALSGVQKNEYKLKAVRTTDGARWKFFPHRRRSVVELPLPSRPARRSPSSRHRGRRPLPRATTTTGSSARGVVPQPGSLLEQAFTYHAVIKVKKPYTAFSDGRRCGAGRRGSRVRGVRRGKNRSTSPS